MVIVFSTCQFQISFLSFRVVPTLICIFSHTNNALAPPTDFISDKFFTGIPFSNSFTSFTSLVTKVVSLVWRLGILPFTPLHSVVVNYWCMGFAIGPSGVAPKIKTYFCNNCCTIGLPNSIWDYLVFLNLSF